MKHVVGVSDMKVSRTPGDSVVTHALGSCLADHGRGDEARACGGIDPEACVRSVPVTDRDATGSVRDVPVARVVHRLADGAREQAGDGEVLHEGGIVGVDHRADHAREIGCVPDVFAYGSQFLDTRWGAINTVVLILSSVTMAAGVTGAPSRTSGGRGARR